MALNLLSCKKLQAVYEFRMVIKLGRYDLPHIEWLCENNHHLASD